MTLLLLFCIAYILDNRQTSESIYPNEEDEEAPPKVIPSSPPAPALEEIPSSITQQSLPASKLPQISLPRDVPSPSSPLASPLEDVPAPSSPLPPQLKDVPAPSSPLPPQLQDVPAPSSPQEPSLEDVPAPSSPQELPLEDVPAPSSPLTPPLEEVSPQSSPLAPPLGPHEETISSEKEPSTSAVEATELKPGNHEKGDTSDLTFYKAKTLIYKQKTMLRRSARLSLKGKYQEKSIP